MRWRASTATAPDFADVEAQLTECVALRRSMRRPGVSLGAAGRPGLVGAAADVAGAWGVRWWQDEQLWEGYVARLRGSPVS